MSKDCISVVTLDNEVANTLEIYEDKELAWENSLFIRISEYKQGENKLHYYLKGVYPYQEEVITNAQLEGIGKNIITAFSVEGVSIIHIGSIQLAIAVFPDACGIAVEGRKWLMDEESKAKIIKFFNK